MVAILGQDVPAASIDAATLRRYRYWHRRSFGENGPLAVACAYRHVGRITDLLRAVGAVTLPSIVGTHDIPQRELKVRLLTRETRWGMGEDRGWLSRCGSIPLPS